MAGKAASIAGPPARAAWRRAEMVVPVLAFALLAALPFLMPLLGGTAYTLTIVARIMIFALGALSLALVLGYGGLVSFGHAAFIGIGSYAVGILAFHGTSEALVALPVAMLAGALFALLTGAVSLRTRGVHFIMITLAFGQMAYFTAVSLSLYGGDDGMSLWTRPTLAGTALLSDRRAFHYIVLALLVLAYLFCHRLTGSRFGRVLVGCRENETRMRALGYDPFRYRLVAYVLSGALAGLAGALLALQTGFVSPAYMTWQRSGELIIMVVLGGTGTLYGALLGAAAYILTEDFLAHFTEHWRMIFGPLLILVVLFTRGGLAALISGGRRD